MTLEKLHEQIEALSAEADQIRHSHATAVTAADNNSKLSELGRREICDGSYETSKARLDALRAEETALIQAKREELERRIAGTASDAATAVSLRDAQDRVDRIETAEQAEKTMARALTTGDLTLANTIAIDARARGWHSAYELYAAKHPHNTGLLSDLAGLKDNARSNLRRSFAYRLPR